MQKRLGKSKNTPPQKMALQNNMVGSFSDRIDTRTKILKNWQLYCSDEELYERYKFNHVIINTKFDSLEFSKNNIKYKF